MIHAERYGTGSDAFVGIHGWGGSHRTFAPLVPYVPVWASLLAIDLPGYGRSSWHPVESVLGIAEQVSAFIATTGCPRVTLVGNCSGAIVGLLTRTPAVSRIVLLDPFAFVPWYFKVFVHPSFGRTAYRSTFANPVGRWLTNLSLKNRRGDGTDLTGSFRNVDHDVSLRYLELLAGIDGIERFRAIDVPVDIVYGVRTFAAVKQSVAEWQALWPHARTFPLEGVGHLPIEEAPADLARIIFTREGSPDA
jgi:pimeloyl-ACP methyl ester carboxylesterase